MELLFEIVAVSLIGIGVDGQGKIRKGPVLLAVRIALRAGWENVQIAVKKKICLGEDMVHVDQGVGGFAAVSAQAPEFLLY